MVPFAVLAVPIATSAFPALSAGGGFDETAAISTRAVIVASWLGAAVLIGARWPLARVFESHDAHGASVLALALAAFAPGLVGYGISANLSRVLYARGRNRATALAIGGGWLLVIAADLVIVPLVAPRHVVPALGLGMSFGLSVSGLALLILVWRDRGALALHGVSRAFLAGLAGAAAGAAVGSVLAGALSSPGFFVNVGMSIVVTLVVIAVFAAVAGGIDVSDLRAAVARLRARPS
jgi:putative peptidoglycan lipid II flippase